MSWKTSDEGGDRPCVVLAVACVSSDRDVTKVVCSASENSLLVEDMAEGGEIRRVTEEESDQKVIRDLAFFGKNS